MFELLKALLILIGILMALIITIILLLTLYITINSIRKTYMQNKQAKQYIKDAEKIIERENNEQ